MLIFTTNIKPEKGTKSYYQVNMKHGVSEVKTGERYTLNYFSRCSQLEIRKAKAIRKLSFCLTLQTVK